MKSDLHCQPHLLYSWGCLFLWFIIMIGIAGCGSSSPRFAGHQTNEGKGQEKHRKGNIRFSSKESEEEKKEDDKKVDIKSVEHRFSSKTPVTTRQGAAPGKKLNEKSGIKETPAVPSQPVTSATFDHQKMMDNILAWMGTPYEYGGDSKSGIDCSAFTREMFKESVGMGLPRTCEEQVKLGSPVEKDNLQFGDLIFFNTTGQNPSHVGIYIGDDMFAHASVSFGVTLSSMYSSYYKKRYTEARRIIQ